MFELPDSDNKTVYVGKNEIALAQGRDGGWAIFGVCDIEGVQYEKMTTFFKITLI